MRKPRYSFATLIKLLLLGFTFTAVIPIAIVLWIGGSQTDARIKENQKLTLRLNRERVERQREINNFIYRQCIEAEIRDTTQVQTNLAIIHVLRPVSTRSSSVRNLIMTLEDSILALEPPGEKDCTPPSASTP